MPKAPTVANIINHIGNGARRLHLHGPVAATTSSKSPTDQIEHLARRSRELDQETRISVWTFSDPTNIQCVVWDKDVAAAA
jgi:hypothetical protein